MRTAYRVAAPSIRFAPWAALASCWPLPQQLLPVSAADGGRRRCTLRIISGKIIFNFAFGATAFAERSVAMKAPVGLLSGRAVCVSRWRGFAPTSSAERSKRIFTGGVYLLRFIWRRRWLRVSPPPQRRVTKPSAHKIKIRAQSSSRVALRSVRKSDTYSRWVTRSTCPTS